MKKGIKKGAALAMTSALVIGMLAACSDGGNNGGTTDSNGNNGGNSAPAVNAAGTFPIVDEPITLRVMTGANAAVEDFETNAFTQWFEEQTNIHVEWELVPSSMVSEKLNLTLASGDLPDVIMTMGVTAEQQALYGEQGILLPLNDYIAEYGVNTKKMFEASPLVEPTITSADGNIYALPAPNECYHCSMRQKMWIYQPWLDELGLDMPTTTEEFYDVLEAFKTQDPNGNGKADEIPFSGAPPQSQTSTLTTSVENFLMNSFTYAPYTRVYLNEQDEVTVPFVQDGWREGLAYLNGLYADGLMDPQALMRDPAQLVQLGENPDVAVLGAVSGPNMSVVTQLNGASGRWMDYVAVPPLKGPDGVQLTQYDPYQVAPGQFVITSEAANPEAAFRFADALYDREVTLRSTIGEPETDWRWAEDGEIGINGEAAVYKDMSKFGVTQNKHWSQTGIAYRPNELRLGQVADEENPLETILYDETKDKYEPYRVDVETVLPPLNFTVDQSQEMADLSKTIYDYTNEMLARFIIGDADIADDAEWEEYLATLDGMNLARYLEIYQEAYETRKAAVQ
ncbi:ABC transporter substrate-binding protein [Paenibacillus sp. IB182496]|uniref:ABC transporter substrate-binding protein n=1 Tax=Paenibacillus sabuli TaxID=2772509 RepID=A0A927BVI0_9BACL|nr:ABC transporter substrate-binding protein [Paenibacillus sabuli]MBD2847601.1 ABC transporter substrate-binding protein [Paenibacillus sabuli]